MLLPREENFLLLFRRETPLDSSVEFMRVRAQLASTGDGQQNAILVSPAGQMFLTFNFSQFDILHKSLRHLRVLFCVQIWRTYDADSSGFISAAELKVSSDVWKSNRNLPEPGGHMRTSPLPWLHWSRPTLFSRTSEAFCQKGFCNTCKTSCKDLLVATTADPTDYFCCANPSKSLAVSQIASVCHRYKVRCSCFALIRSDKDDLSHVNRTRAPTLKILTIWYRSIRYLSHSSCLLPQYNQVSLLSDARHVIIVAEVSQEAAVS